MRRTRESARAAERPAGPPPRMIASKAVLAREDMGVKVKVRNISVQWGLNINGSPEARPNGVDWWGSRADGAADPSGERDD